MEAILALFQLLLGLALHKIMPIQTISLKKKKYITPQQHVLVMSFTQI